MAWTYNTLKSALQSWNENTGSDFVAAIDNIIMLAEDRILREADLDKFRKYATSSLSVGDRFVTRPSDMLIDRWFIIEDSLGKRHHLQRRDNSWLQEYWDDITETGLPKFYSDWDDDSFVIAPPSDASHDVELAYTYRPDGMTSSNQTTWIGTHAPRVLFSACMVECMLFNKMAMEDIQIWEEYYNRALRGLTTEQVTRQRINENDTGEVS